MAQHFKIVSADQNDGVAIIPAHVKQLLNGRGALQVALVNVSGDQYDARGGAAGSGGDGAILDGVDTNIKASVKNTAGAKPLHVIITNVSGDTPNLPSSNPDGSVVDGATPAIKATVRQYTRSNPIAVVLTNASGDTYNASAGSSSGGDGAILDGANSAIKGTVKQYANSNPLTVVLVNASGDAYNGNQTSVSVNKWNLTPIQDSIHLNSGLTGVTGDVSTQPRAGQVWPVREQGIVGVQIVGGSIGARIQPSGDLMPVTVGAVTASVGVTGDVSTVPKAGQTWPVSVSSTLSVSEQNKTGVHVAGGLTGVTGDVSTVPAAGQTWPVSVASNVNVSEQGKIGVHVAGGRIGVTGDSALNDGADPTIKATVRDYTNSNPLAVVLTNSSGDISSHPTPPQLQTARGRIASAGSNSIVGAVSGRRIKVVGYELQADGDNARGFFASGASGAGLTTEWELAFREGVVRQVEGGRDRGYLFATTAGQALSFESSSSQAMKYAVTYQVEDVN